MNLREFVTQIVAWTEGKLGFGVVISATRGRGGENFTAMVMTVWQPEKQTWHHVELWPEQVSIQAQESDAPAVKSGRPIISLCCSQLAQQSLYCRSNCDKTRKTLLLYVFKIYVEPVDACHLRQSFPIAGPRSGTGPWHQLYWTARGSPGICHFNFLINFH
jgi:hypothetical protein